MFEYDESTELYTEDLGNVIVTCDEIMDGFEELAERMADIYAARLDDIADFLIKEGISDIYGELTANEIKDALGVPTIDIGNQTVTYFDHTLDEEHIISFEYDDKELKGFMYLSIDG